MKLLPEWFGDVVIGTMLMGACAGLAVAGQYTVARWDERAAESRKTDAEHAALVSCKAAVDAVIVASNESPRCFELQPMCSGAAHPVCICGFYSVTCRWECAQ